MDSFRVSIEAEIQAAGIGEALSRLGARLRDLAGPNPGESAPAPMLLEIRRVEEASPPDPGGAGSGW
jgi:hypothetical protein